MDLFPVLNNHYKVRNKMAFIDGYLSLVAADRSLAVAMCRLGLKVGCAGRGGRRRGGFLEMMPRVNGTQEQVADEADEEQARHEVHRRVVGFGFRYAVLLLIR
jgi:hypothetical protein